MFDVARDLVGGANSAWVHDSLGRSLLNWRKEKTLSQLYKMRPSMRLVFHFYTRCAF
jgi:hypothetical protein